MNETVKKVDPRYDVNNDTFISIDDELKPRLLGETQIILRNDDRREV
jgi:hypothetical protein